MGTNFIREMARKVGTHATDLAKNPGRAPFVTALQKVESGQASTFSAVETDFLRTMEQFDQLVKNGTAKQGDWQNGKGDFFNDVLALLLERRSGKLLHPRPKIPGLLFESHNLDAAYPKEGDVAATFESKAVGNPKHPRNPKEGPEGRRVSADLDKRIKKWCSRTSTSKASTPAIKAKVAARTQTCGPG